MIKIHLLWRNKSEAIFISTENNISEGLDVKTVEAISEDGLLVEETSIPIAQLCFVGAGKKDDVIYTNQLDEDVRVEIKKKMFNVLSNLDSELNLEEYQISKKDRNETGLVLTATLYYEMLNENPGIFYTAPKIKTYYNAENQVKKVSFTYMCNDNEITGGMSEDETVVGHG